MHGTDRPRFEFGYSFQHIIQIFSFVCVAAKSSHLLHEEMTATLFVVIGQRTAQLKPNPRCLFVLMGISTCVRWIPQPQNSNWHYQPGNFSKLLIITRRFRYHRHISTALINKIIYWTRENGATSNSIEMDGSENSSFVRINQHARTLYCQDVRGHWSSDNWTYIIFTCIVLNSVSGMSESVAYTRYGMCRLISDNTPAIDIVLVASKPQTRFDVRSPLRRRIHFNLMASAGCY